MAKTNNQPFGVVASIKTAVHPRNRVATVAGAILGGFVPLATYTIAHFDARTAPMLWALVGGGLLYSATTMFDWGKQAFRSTWKSLGFVVLLEGTMTFAHTMWLAYLALGLLVGVNAIAAGTKLTAKGAR